MKKINIAEIQSPADFRTLSMSGLQQMANDVRNTLLDKLAAHGGHIGPNLGMVEAVIALHYVFNTPEDKIVFDVSHQTYPHKMITGRIQAFIDPQHYDDVTGYTNPTESEYDLFSLGHTSSAIALAAGIAKARDLNKESYNVVSVIGDGSLSGGIAFEGLDYGATLNSNFIIIVNDNQMSIAENHGGIYNGLKKLRESNGNSKNNIFKTFGFDYRYVEDGNNLQELIETFKSVKDIDHPIVVHINTLKGKGLKEAEINKESYHYGGPFDRKSGKPLDNDDDVSQDPTTYNDLFAINMLKQMSENSRVVTITAGTPGVLGFTPDRRIAAGRQFIDVAIAEQAAVDVASGLAKSGMRPVVGLVSSFLQRAYDQFSQDIALNKQPATFVIFYGSIFGMNDETHLGFFDIALLSNIPDLLYLAPTCREEFQSMLDWSIRQSDIPVVIRTPGVTLQSNPDVTLLEDYSKIEYDRVRDGGDVALIGAGLMFDIMRQAADILNEKGCRVTLINPRNLSSLDSSTLDTLKSYKRVITAEDGIIDGGFGQKIASYLGQAAVEVINLGVPKKFLNRYRPSELLRQCNMTPQQIADLAFT